MSTPGIAANAYAKVARVADPTSNFTQTIADSGANGGKSFGALLKDAVGYVAEAGRKSDAQAHAMAAGKANIVDVVTAVSETEVAIEAMVSVRDKVIAAYEEIMKMPI
jgi:flagellar hook-basal body complex protein FliE